MYELWYTNFKYLDDKVFDSLDDAIQYGKSKGFEFSVFLDGDMVGSAEGVSLTWYQISNEETRMLTKDQAVDKLMHSDVDSLRETCYYAYKDQHGIKGHHLLNWTVAELVSWWITYYEWNEACQMWEFRVFDSI